MDRKKYTFRKDLFVVDGKQLKFCLVDCRQLPHLKEYIEHGNGVLVQDTKDEDTIFLSDNFCNGYPRLTKPSFVIDSCRQNKMLNLEHYRLSRNTALPIVILNRLPEQGPVKKETSPSSCSRSQSSSSFISSANTSTHDSRNSQSSSFDESENESSKYEKPTSTCIRYSKTERRAIVKYLVKNIKRFEARRNKNDIFREIENKEVVVGRTASSIKQQFYLHILPNLTEYTSLQNAQALGYDENLRNGPSNPRPFTQEEDAKIVNYLMSLAVVERLGGNYIYKEMSRLKVVDRPWSSIRNRYVNYLSKTPKDYIKDEKTLRKFKKFIDIANSRKSNKNKKNYESSEESLQDDNLQSDHSTTGKETKRKKRKLFSKLHTLNDDNMESNFSLTPPLRKKTKTLLQTMDTSSEDASDQQFLSPGKTNRSSTILNSSSEDEADPESLGIRNKTKNHGKKKIDLSTDHISDDQEISGLSEDKNHGKKKIDLSTDHISDDQEISELSEDIEDWEDWILEDSIYIFPADLKFATGPERVREHLAFIKELDEKHKGKKWVQEDDKEFHDQENVTACTSASRKQTQTRSKPNATLSLPEEDDQVISTPEFPMPLNQRLVHKDINKRKTLSVSPIQSVSIETGFLARSPKPALHDSI